LNSDTGAIIANIWQHIAFSYKNNSAILFLNGNPIVSNMTVSGSINDTTSSFTIGTATTDYFNGSIDEVAIYNRSLSAAEVMTLYQRGMAQYYYDNSNLTQNVYDCGTLNTTNAVYTLMNNVTSNSTCFTILANNITFDGAGYMINYSANGTLGYGFNRLVMGESIHQNFNTNPVKLLSGIALGGGSGYHEQSGPDQSTPRRFIRFNIVYGNPLEKTQNFKPFNNFSFVTILNFSRREYVGEIYASGMLGKIYTRHANRSKLVVALFQNYDFMNQDDYKVSSSSIGPGLIHTYTLSPELTLGTHVNGSFIFMGSAGDILDDVETRDYHFGQGYSTKFMARLGCMITG